MATETFALYMGISIDKNVLKSLVEGAMPLDIREFAFESIIVFLTTCSLQDFHFFS